MKQQKFVAILVAACLVLGGAAIVVKLSQDREAPVIKVKKADITYQAGQGYEELLKGVSAEDNHDGDLTKEIFVDRVVQVKDDQAVVYYGVTDKAKNVGTAKRTVKYVADASAEGQVKADTDTEQSEEAKADAPAPEAQPETATDNKDELVPTGEAPVIALTTDHVTIAAGTEFDLMSVVKGVADSNDDADMLSTRISVDGEYNTGTPGNYTLQYYVMDSDGNPSEVKTLTLTVQ